MSAIGAIFERSGAPVDNDSIERMTSALRVHGALRQQHRRIDNMAGCWTKGTEYTPEDRFEQQPIVDGDTIFLFTGFLTYREDLFRALALEPSRLKSMSDSALAHAAWKKWGRDALLRIEGHWAFILLDVARQSLFAAKSPLKSPPLVYHDSPDLFAIASAPKGLFALSNIPREIDEVYIADALILNFEDSGRGYFKGVTTLPSGHSLEVTRESRKLEQYYELDDLEPVRFARDEDYIEALDALMRDSIKCSMRGFTTPATTVSAGLDSSTVAVYALEALERGVHGFTEPLLGFTHVPGKDWDGRVYGPGRIGDESGPVKALARMYPQFDVTFVDSEGLSVDHKLDDLIRLAEMPPFGWNNLHWGSEIARQVRAAGRNVLLGGASGNRTISFSNRNIHTKLLREGRWREMHRHLREMNIEQGMVKRYLRFVLQPYLPAGLSKMISRMRGDLGHAGFTAFSAINRDYAKDMRVLERAKDMGWDDSYSTIRSPQELRKRMTFNGNRDQGALMQLASETLHGVAHRDPLGCRRITEFCMSIPDEQYLNSGTDRWLARRLMKGRLPPEILNFSSRGRQSADWHSRFTRDIDRFRDEFERIADDPEMAKRFDVERVRNIFQTWPDKTPLDASDHPDYLVAMVGLGRMFGMSRFINWVNGKNL